MNKIEVKSIATIYDYEETYWFIDDKPVVYYVDGYVTAGKCPSLGSSSSCLGLLPAWEGELFWKAENDFIWELVDSQECLNVPILVCEEDCDLDCVIIAARIRKSADRVFWDKIGLVNHENFVFQKEQESGILFTDVYSQEDWDKYGDNIALETSDSEVFKKWVSENWHEELLRRRRNYTKPYLQQEENITWIESPCWEFDLAEYNKATEVYRELYRRNNKKQC